MAQDILTEGPVIRAVAETARDNGDQGPAGPEQGQGERDKGRIEIDRFDPCVTQQSPVGGLKRRCLCRTSVEAYSIKSV